VANHNQRSADDALRAWLEAGSDDPRDVCDERLKQYLLEGRRERRPIDPLTKSLLPPTRNATGQNIEDARRWAGGWAALGYRVDEVRRWLRAGAQPHDYELAADLESEGITPEQAGEQFQHPRTGELVTIFRVARDQVSFLRIYDNFRSLNDALDDAGIERTKPPRRHNVNRHRDTSA